MTISALLERVRAATGPDRELEYAMYPVVEPYIGQFWPHWSPDQREGLTPRYTASIDAITALIERELPEANCYGFDKGPKECAGYVSRNNVKSGHWMREEYAATPALALCAAFLAAKLALTETPSNAA